MVAQVSTISFIGIEAKAIEVQAHMCSGLPAFNIVGLANKAVVESKERIRSAFASIGLSLPMKRLTVNLSPADLTKEGSYFDLPIAVSLLVEMQIIPQDEVAAFIIMGELALDGRLIRISGALPAAIYANAKSFGILCPKENATEALWSGNNTIITANNLLEVINHFTNKQLLPPTNQPGFSPVYALYPDMKDVKGQNGARKAIEVAAAGRHNILMIGPPGSGKSMLAKRLPGILPELSNQEKLELSIIASIAGELNEHGLVTQRPFRDPHSSSSLAAIIGGGKNAKPGEITLAHRGILFLDELPEFPRNILDALRQPIESKAVTIARVSQHITYPADCQLVAAMNPCKCGYFGSGNIYCSKAPKCAEEYQNRISGPLFDRFDLQVELSEMKVANIMQEEPSEASSVITDRVAKAIHKQYRRYKDYGIQYNSELDNELLHNTVILDKDTRIMMEAAIHKFHLSMRGVHRVLKITRTIADLDDSNEVTKLHLAEALTYRILRSSNSNHMYTTFT